MTESDSDAGETDPNEVLACLVRTWPLECIGYIAVAALVGFVAFFLFVPCLLSLLGFRRIGVREGSGAAQFQVGFLMPIYCGISPHHRSTSVLSSIHYIVSLLCLLSVSIWNTKCFLMSSERGHAWSNMRMSFHLWFGRPHCRWLCRCLLAPNVLYRGGIACGWS